MALGAAAVWVPLLVWPMVLIDVAIALLALADLLVSGGKVEAGRAFKHIQAVGRAFPVHVTVRNLGRRKLHLRLVDDAPSGADSLQSEGTLAPGTEATFRYELSLAERGEHRFGPVVVRWRSPLGLFERQRRLDVPGTVHVYPDFAQLRRYGLKGPQQDRRAPVRVRRRPGGENEFERNRPYVPGDPYRHIDWRATARKGEYITREFGQESNQNVIFLLDCGRMMSARGEGVSTFDHALNAALMMGHTALKHGDRVGLLAFDSKVRAWLPPKSGTRSGSRLIRGTYDLFPSLDEPDYALAFRHLATHVRRRSLVVLLTAVIDEVNASSARSLAGALAGRHLALSVWVRDPEVDELLDAPPSDTSATYIRGAAAELALEREKSLAALRKRGVLAMDAGPEELTSTLIGQYLEIKARRLL